jgi:aryl-alcohol dehydrogenase-like predicted oxidoreductase
MAELVIAWVLRQPAVTGAINGIRSPQEALAMPGGLNWKLTDQELQTIEEALTFWNQLWNKLNDYFPQFSVSNQ